MLHKKYPNLITTLKHYCLLYLSSMILDALHLKIRNCPPLSQQCAGHWKQHSLLPVNTQKQMAANFKSHGARHQLSCWPNKVCSMHIVFSSLVPKYLQSMNLFDRFGAIAKKRVQNMANYILSYSATACQFHNLLTQR